MYASDEMLNLRDLPELLNFLHEAFGWGVGKDGEWRERIELGVHQK